MRIAVALPVLALVLAVSVTLGVLVGAVAIAPLEVWSAIWGGGDTVRIAG